MGRIILRAVGDLPNDLLTALRERLAEKLPAEQVTIGTPLAFPDYAHNARRDQYHADAVVEHLRPVHRVDHVVELGVTAVDLYAQGLSFVFGVADPAGRAAIVSTHRLCPEFYGQPKEPGLLVERTWKEALHELGHVFGLGHSANPRCIMFFSMSIADTDRKCEWPCGADSDTDSGRGRASSVCP